jgi:hypothetical protein
MWRVIISLIFISFFLTASRSHALNITAWSPNDLKDQSSKMRQAVSDIGLSDRRGDFDGDGKTDVIVRERFRFSVKFGNGRKFVWNTQDDETRITGMEPIRLGSSRQTSFILSIVRYAPEKDIWFSRRPQVLILNRGGGHFEAKVLNHIRIIGRNVVCTPQPGREHSSLCMFASYADKRLTYSTLVEVRESGAVTDVTSKWNLPFNGAHGTDVGDGKYTNGRFMMGFAFVDLNADGLPDLVGAGQHSQVMYAIMRKQGRHYEFKRAQWFEQADEYLGVSALDLKGRNFPCVYLHLEKESSRQQGDFLTCYNKSKDRWYTQRMPWRIEGGDRYSALEQNTKKARMTAYGSELLISTHAIVGRDKKTSVVLRVTPRSMKAPAKPAAKKKAATASVKSVDKPKPVATTKAKVSKPLRKLASTVKYSVHWVRVIFTKSVLIRIKMFFLRFFSFN